MAGWGNYSSWDANRTGKGDSRNADRDGDGQADNNYQNAAAGQALGVNSSGQAIGNRNPWGNYFPSAAFGSMVQATGDSTPFGFGFMPGGRVTYNNGYQQPLSVADRAGALGLNPTFIPQPAPEQPPPSAGPPPPPQQQNNGPWSGMYRPMGYESWTQIQQPQQQAPSWMPGLPMTGAR